MDGYFRVADDETSDKYYNADRSGNKIWDINKNTTLYACWSANKYQVNFDMDGITQAHISASEQVLELIILLRLRLQMAVLCKHCRQ